MFRCTLAVLVVSALAAGEISSSSARSLPLGVVTQANHATLGQGNVSVGSAVYDGDSFATASDGVLRVRSGAAQFFLASQSQIQMHTASIGPVAQLTGGTIVFSSAKISAMDIEVAKARIHPASDQPTVGQISVVGPRTIDIRAKRGSLKFSYAGEEQLIPEGASYRFVIDPTEAELAAAEAKSGQAQQAPRHQGRERKGFYYVIIGAMAIGTYLALDEALESPSKP